MGLTVAVHVNKAQPHQMRYGRALHKGLSRNGLRATLTNDPRRKADLHVCIGPWFALHHWKHDKTLYLDRAYWDDPECVSIHWLSGGEKHFTKINELRDHPMPKPYRDAGGTIYLCDFNEKPVGAYDAVREHPANGATGTLLDALRGHRKAVGRRTTALVDAAIEGLVVETTDPHSPVREISGRRGGRYRWLNHLAWHNWSLPEIENGAFLDALGNPYKAD